MRIGIDLTSFHRKHDGGKEQVLFNLLKGFNELGASKKICIFCYGYMIETIRQIIPDAEIVNVEPAKFPKKLIADYWVKTFRLPKLIEKHDISILFFPVSHTGLKRFPIPTVILPHDIQPISQRENYSVVERLKYQCIYHFDFLLRDHILSISNFDLTQLKIHYPQHTHKFKRIYNPITMKPNADPPKRTQTIMAINIQHIHKNIKTLIKAFSIIQDEIPHTLVLVGSENERTAHLSTCIAEEKLTERVQFTGFLSDEDLHRRLEESALYVNPSLFEGFGMTAIEAMILKVPVIVADTTASPEVTKGLCAYYSPVTDENVLAKKILANLQNPPDQATLHAISNQIESAYSHKKIAKEYLEFFQTIYEKKSAEVVI
jgi:glycosyltransferase involved in cell wall biosynthesis